MSEQQGGPAQGSGSTQRQASTPPEDSGRALVLSGGGIKGAYQIGAIVEVIKSGFQPTAIYGISIGALNGGILTSYVGAQIVTDKSKPPDFLAAASRVEEYWRSNVTGFEKLGYQRSKLALCWDVITRNFKGILNVDGVIEMARNEIRDVNLQEAAKAGLSFFAGALNLSAGTYLDAEGSRDQILEYIIASGMAPIAMPMRVIRQADSEPPYREDSWLDGGVHNVAPLRAPIDKNCKDIVCIVCRPDKLGPRSGLGDLMTLGDRVSDVVTQRLLDHDMAQTLRMNEWVDRIQRKGVTSDFDRDFLKEFKKINLRIVRPAKDLGVDLLNFTQRDIEMMIKKGHLDAEAEMKAPPRRWTPGNPLGVSSST